MQHIQNTKHLLRRFRGGIGNELRLSRFLPVLDALGLLDLIIRFKTRGSLLIIMYHEIERNVYYDIGLSKQYFENQLQYLLKLGFRIMPLCEALELIMSNKALIKLP